MNDWTKDYFTEEYLLKYRPRQTKSVTKRECDFIIKVLDPDRKELILDIACGYGRHVKELIFRGYDVKGIDSCELYVEKAVCPCVYCGDMRDFKFYPVSSCYNFFTSFGYYGDDENERVIKCVSDSLVDGGKFLLHVRNREWIMRNIVEKQWDSYGDHTELTERRFELLTSRMVMKIKYFPSNKEVTQSIRFYTLAEIDAMFRRNGLRITETYGDIDFSPYTIDSEWMAVVAKKGGQNERDKV